MSTVDEEALKRRYRQFLELMPLTLAIAGLPQSQGAISFNSDQMEVRAATLLQAYKHARHIMREAIGS